MPLLVSLRDACPSHQGRAFLFLAVILPLAMSSAIFAETPLTALEDTRERLILDAPPEPLLAEQTQEEKDRAESLAHFSTAYRQQKQGQKAFALRHYERAFRYAPTSPTVIEALLPLAVDLNRLDEAARYAVLAPSLNDANPMMLRRLAVHLAEQGDYVGASEVLGKAIASRADADASLALRVYLRYEHGRQCYLAKRNDEGADSFLWVMDRVSDPEKYSLNMTLLTMLLDAETLYELMGEALLAAERFDDAEKAFRLTTPDPDAPSQLDFRLARIALHKGDAKTAFIHWNKHAEQADTDRDAMFYRLLQAIYYKAASPEGLASDGTPAAPTALGQLEKLHAADPENTALSRVIVENYLKQDRDADVADLLGKCPDLEDDAPGLVAELAFRQRNADRAYAALSRLLQADGSLVRAGATCAKITKDTSFVDAMLDAVPDDDNNADWPGLVVVADLLSQADRMDEANALFERAIAMEVSAEDAVLFDRLLLAWGVRMLALDRPSDAVLPLRLGLERQTIAPAKGMFVDYLATALELEGKTQEAIEVVQRLAVFQPSPMLQSRIAWLHLHAGNEEEARSAYERILERYDPVFGGLSARASVAGAKRVLASLYMESDEAERAIELLEQTLDEFPDDAGTLNDLGYYWADAGLNLPRAHRMILRAVDAEPDNAAYRDSLGWALYRLGRFDDAIRELERAAATRQDADIQEHLGAAHEAAGTKNEAIKAYKKAIQLIKSSEDGQDEERSEHLRSKIDALEASDDASQ